MPELTITGELELLGEREQAATIRQFLTEQCQKVTALAATRIYAKKEAVKKSAKRLALEKIFADRSIEGNDGLAHPLRDMLAVLIEEPISLPSEERSAVTFPFFCAFVPVRTSDYGHNYPLRRVSVAYLSATGRAGYPVGLRYDASAGNVMSTDIDGFRLALPGEIAEFWQPFSLNVLKSIQRKFNSEIRSPESPAHVYGVL